MKNGLIISLIIAFMTSCSGSRYEFERIIGDGPYIHFKKNSGEQGIAYDKVDNVIFEEPQCENIIPLPEANGEVTHYFAALCKNADGNQFFKFYESYDCFASVKGNKICRKNFDVKKLNDIYNCYLISLDDEEEYYLLMTATNVVTPKAYKDYSFLCDEEALHFILAENESGYYDIYRRNLIQAIDGQYKNIQTHYIDDNLYYTMQNKEGYMGVWDEELNPVIPEVYNDIEKVAWTDDEETYWLVSTHANAKGLYKTDGSPIIREEYNFKDIDLMVESADNYKWLLLTRNTSGSKYYAASRWGKQKTEGYDYGVFYKSGSFYYYKDKYFNSSAKCENSEWSGEFYDAINGLQASVIMYSDGCRVHGKDSDKLTFKGYKNGYRTYDQSSTITWFVSENGLIMKQYIFTNVPIGFLPPPPIEKDYYFTRMYVTTHTLSDYSESIGFPYSERKLAEIKYARNQSSLTDFHDIASRISDDNLKLEYNIPNNQLQTPVFINMQDIKNEYDTNDRDWEKEANKKLKEENYRRSYETAEKRVKNWYDICVSSGFKTNDGKNGYMNLRNSDYASFSKARNSFDRSQSELRDIRRRALRDGVDIQQSFYETVTIQSYYN